MPRPFSASWHFGVDQHQAPVAIVAISKLREPLGEANLEPVSSNVVLDRRRGGFGHGAPRCTRAARSEGVIG